MKKAWMPALLAGLGGIVLILAAVAARSDDEPSPSSRRATPERESGKGGTLPAVESAGRPAGAGAFRSSTSGGSVDVSVIRARVRAMEARLQALEIRRDQLKSENEGLSLEIAELNQEARAQAIAKGRVRSWEKLLGLTEAQKDELVELWTAYAREDQGGKASPSTWLIRESEVRARLSAEQSLRLHDALVEQTNRYWSYMGRKLGGIVGAPAEEHSRYQQVLGFPALPGSALLREAHEADWTGLMRQASGMLRPHLPADQATRLDQFVSKYN